jgi:hypothetical protein
MRREILNRLIRTAGIYAVPGASMLCGLWIFGARSWLAVVWTLITVTVFITGCYVVDSWAKRLPLIVALLSLAVVGAVKDHIKNARGEIYVYLSCCAVSMWLEVKSRRERLVEVADEEW